MNNKYDAIIIGAGVGGLICGTRLAKNGMRVLIIEQHDKPGGCVTSCRKKGYNFDYGAHIFGSCNKNGVLYYYLRELGISDINFVRLRPTDRIVFPDRAIEIPQNLDEYIDFLRNHYSEEAKNIGHFFAEVIRIARSFSSDTMLSRYKKLTFANLMKKYFKDEKLMSILSAQFRYLGSPPYELAATSMCLMTVSYLRDGAYYPKGGTQNFSDGIARKFRDYGGTLLLKKQAVKIITQNRKAVGVKTDDNEIYVSNIIVANGDAIKTFFNMVDKKEIGSGYLKKIGRMKIGPSFFMTYLGVKGDLDLKNKSGWYHFAYGLRLKPSQSLYIFVPSAIDSSTAPKNRHVIELAFPFPYEFTTIRDWRSCKKTLEDKLLESANRIIPGLRNSIEFKESATPRTVERYTYNSHGSMCGWKMSVDQVHEHRLSYETPIDGLYVAGHWTNPGCGVAPVATSGWIVANKIIQRRDARKLAVMSLSGEGDV